MANNKYNDFIGTEIGDFVVVQCLGTDASKHKNYLCKCKRCGAVLIGTAYALKNRKDTTCHVCLDNGLLNKNDENNMADKMANKVIEALKDGTEVNTDNENDSIDDVNDVTEEDCCYNEEECYKVYDPYDDSYDIDPAVTGVKLFCGGRGYEENNGNSGSGIYKAYPIIGDLAVCVREIKADLMSLPRYTYIAHCIPADLSCYGKTAKIIDAFYNLAYNLEFFCANGERKVGGAMMYSNIITMFPNEKGKIRPCYEDLLSCVRSLAKMCAEQRVQFLAMPHIGMGGNHVKCDWETVKGHIIEIFINEYTRAFDLYYGEESEDENYLPANIYISFCDYPNEVNDTNNTDVEEE